MFKLFYNTPIKLAELSFNTELEMRDEARKHTGLVLGQKRDEFGRIIEVYHL